MFEYHQPPYHHLLLVVLLDSWHAKEEEEDEKEEKLEMEPGGKGSSNHKLSFRFCNSIPNGKNGHQNLIFPSVCLKVFVPSTCLALKGLTTGRLA